MNRDDAQALIETGLTQGHARVLSAVVMRLRNAIVEETVALLLDELTKESANAAKVAAEYTDRAQALLNDLEHPGARLARRVVFSVRAAREAWRASR